MMNYTTNEVAKLIEKINNIFEVDVKSSTQGSKVKVSLPEAVITATCFTDIKTGKALLLRTEDNQYFLVQEASTSPSAFYKNIELRRIKIIKKVDEYRVPVLFYVEDNQQHPCTCSTWRRIGSKCKEVCDGTGEFPTLQKCLQGGEPGELPQIPEPVYLYISSGSNHWHEASIRYANNPDGQIYNYFIFPNRPVDEPGFGSTILDNAGNNAHFIYDLTDSLPDFPVGISFTGAIRWRGITDYQAIQNTSLTLIRPDRLQRPTLEFVNIGSSNYQVWTGGDASFYYEGSYYGQYASGFVDDFGGFLGFGLGIRAIIDRKDKDKVLEYLNLNLMDRVTTPFRIDFMVDGNGNKLDPEQPPPPIIPEPPDPGRKVFYLGGDRKPLRLEFNLQKDDPFLAAISATAKESFITIRHGVDSLGRFSERACKITVIKAKKTIFYKQTFSHPALPPPEPKDWRTPQIYSYAQDNTVPDACFNEHARSVGYNFYRKKLYSVETTTFPSWESGETKVTITIREFSSNGACVFVKPKEVNIKIKKIALAQLNTSVKIVGCAPCKA